MEPKARIANEERLALDNGEGGDNHLELHPGQPHLVVDQTFTNPRW
jgi:hypothetical protein